MLTALSLSDTLLLLALGAAARAGGPVHSELAGRSERVGIAANPAARETLRLAERHLSDASYSGGLAAALPAAMAPDAVLLLEGAPILQGKDPIARLLQAQPELAAVKLSWAPFRVLVASDGSLGVTFGGTVRHTSAGAPTTGRYMTVWRRGAAGAWEVVAHAQTGLLESDPVLPARGDGAAGYAQVARGAFAEADLAFAKMAGDSGAPAAFRRYIAPDGMTLAGTGELNIGPAAAQARLAEGRAGTAHWQWHPVISFGARSGELGATIGEAEIRPAQGSASETFYSKYLTIWQRQPDGTLRFVVDGGSGRPAPGQ